MALSYQDYQIQALQRPLVIPRVRDAIYGPEGSRCWRQYASRIETINDETFNYPVLVSTMTGTPRARLGSPTISTSEHDPPATQATTTQHYWDLTVNIHDDEVKQNQNAQALANIVRTYSDRAALAARTFGEQYLCWTAEATTYPSSLVDAISGAGHGAVAQTYNGISTSDLPQWEAFTMECLHSTSNAYGVSPSFKNVQLLLSTMSLYNGKLPDEGYTHPTLWNTWADWVLDNDYKGFDRTGVRVDVGVGAIYVLGVPIYADRYVPGSAYSSGKSTRALSLGYACYFIDWDSIHPYCASGMALQMGPQWLRPHDDFRIYNYIRYMGNVYCDNRRMNGVIYNIDPSQAETSWHQGGVYWGGSLVGGTAPTT